MTQSKHSQPPSCAATQSSPSWEPGSARSPQSAHFTPGSLARQQPPTGGIAACGCSLAGRGCGRRNAQPSSSDPQWSRGGRFDSGSSICCQAPDCLDRPGGYLMPGSFCLSFNTEPHHRPDKESKITLRGCDGRAKVTQGDRHYRRF